MLKPALRLLLDRLLFIPALLLVIGPAQTAAAAVMGDYYVSGDGDDLNGDGTEGNPWRTITWAHMQSGGGAPTIHVGPGDYKLAEGGPGTGELFPIPVDVFDDQGLKLVGPGDGTARILNYTGSEELAQKGGGPSTAGILTASSRINGSVEVSGLRFESQSGGLPLHQGWFGGEEIAFEFEAGVDSLTITNNEISGLQVLDVNVAEGFACLIENNYIADAGGGVILRNSVSSSTVIDSAEINLVLRDNEFVRVDYPVSYELTVTASAILNVELTAEDNIFSSCSSGYYPQYYLEGGGRVVDTVTVRGDEYLNVYYPYYRSVRGNGTIGGDALIENNLMAYTSGSRGSSGVYFGTSLWSSGTADVSIAVQGNQISGYYYGVDAYLEVEQSANLLRDVSIVNNIVTSCSTGVLIEHYLSGSTATSNHLVESLVLDGNEIEDVGSGVRIVQEIVGLYSIDQDYQLTRNEIDMGESGDGWAIYYEVEYSSSALADSELELRGNVLRRSPSEGPLAFAAGAFDSGLLYVESEDRKKAFQEFSFDGGTVAAPGFNTINSQDEAVASSVALLLDASPDVSLDLYGNWWGTTNPVSVEERVFHGADSGTFVVADISNPLADDLTFSVSQPGDQVKLTADAGSGFVPYAGTLTIAVTVDGDPVNNLSVADDFASLTFDNDYSGPVEICVTNPGGQSGCLTSTVTAAEDGDSGGGGGGGCGVMPVSGGTPTAGDFLAQYFLLFLPVLFLLRRRMTGVRPQPVGYAA